MWGIFYSRRRVPTILVLKSSGPVTLVLDTHVHVFPPHSREIIRYLVFRGPPSSRPGSSRGLRAHQAPPRPTGLAHDGPLRTGQDRGHRGPHHANCVVIRWRWHPPARGGVGGHPAPPRPARGRSGCAETPAAGAVLGRGDGEAEAWPSPGVRRGAPGWGGAPPAAPPPADPRGDPRHRAAGDGRARRGRAQPQRSGGPDRASAALALLLLPSRLAVYDAPFQRGMRRHLVVVQAAVAAAPAGWPALRAAVVATVRFAVEDPVLASCCSAEPCTASRPPRRPTPPAGR